MKYRISIIIKLLLIIFVWVASAHGKELSFAVIADHRKSYRGLEDALEFLDSQDLDFIIVAGDFDPTENGYLNLYVAHGYTVGPEHLSSRQKVYFVLGNHDSPPSGDLFFQKRIAPYYPTNGPSSAPKGTIFSFDWAECHFVVTNQYWNYPSGGYTAEQLNWLNHDLDSTKKPFRFVIGHEPAFPRFRHVGNSLDADPLMRHKFLQILSKHKVQAFFTGHVHYCYATLFEGVYELNAGKARTEKTNVIVVNVFPNAATVHLFRTNGRVPAMSDEFRTVILKPIL